jgi:uncharacterized protein
MDLKSRLAKLDSLTRRPTPVSAPGSVNTPDAFRDVTSEASLLTTGLGLSASPRADGTLWWRDDVAAQPAPPALALPEVVAVLPAGLPLDLRPPEILFLDIETTGLAGGTGSLAFLVGLGWWDDGGFVVRQLFLPGPGREGPLLEELAATAARFRVVVTYNGASFDLPILRTRALLARRDDPFAGLASWDLLTAVRRLWRRSLENCRQQSAEVELCGLTRPPGDIEGALIPYTYFRWLRENDPGLLPAVLLHNRLDVAGMGHLLHRVLDAAATLAPAPPAYELWRGTWREAWSRGRICERQRLADEAAGWLARAVDDAGIGVLAPGHLDVPLAFLLDAVRVLKRTADWPRVAVVLESALVRHPQDMRLLREAAILYERRLVDLVRALQHAEALGDARRIARLRARLG